MTSRATILVMLGSFKPSFRISGANSVFLQAAAALADRFRFRVVSEADEGETVGKWHEFEGCERIALTRGALSARGVGEVLRETPSDLVQCNGFFDRGLTLPTLTLHALGRVPSRVLLAPHGEFSPGALALKARRKKPYTRFLRYSGLLRDVSIQATSHEEASQLRIALPEQRVLLGPNVRALEPLPVHPPPSPGAPLRVAFLSRIDRMKNLDVAISLLGETGLPIAFDIFGPVSDPAYWAECRQAIDQAPATLRSTYLGPVVPREVLHRLAAYDLFILPTRGENFSYAIAESLLAGTPVLIADTTPWRGLEAAKAGADLPLDDREQWLRFLRSFAALDPAQRFEWRHGARRCAEQRLDPVADAERLAACFEAAMGR